MRSDLLATLNAERAGRRAVILLTDLATGVQRLVRAADIANDPLGEELEERLRSGKSGLLQAGATFALERRIFRLNRRDSGEAGFVIHFREEVICDAESLFAGSA